MEKNPKSFYRVRFSDCDLLGHLNNARYIDYFLNAREDHIKEHYDLDLRTFYAKGLSWVVGSHEIIYRKPAQYNDEVCISSHVLRLGSDSMLVELVMMDKEQTHLKSILWTTFISIDVKTGKRQDHPDYFMEFARQVEEPEIDIAGGIRGREAVLRKPAAEVRQS